MDHGRSGFRFADLDGLVEHTRRLIGDEELRSRLASAARARAGDFGWGPFVARVRAEIASA